MIATCQQGEMEAHCCMLHCNRICLYWMVASDKLKMYIVRNLEKIEQRTLLNKVQQRQIQNPRGTLIFPQKEEKKIGPKQIKQKENKQQGSKIKSIRSIILQNV